MQKILSITLLLSSIVCSAAATARDPTATQHPLAWMEGCWQSTDGTTRETWTSGFDSHLFGHSITSSDGKVKFFEQMRIDHVDGKWTFHAYPRSAGPSSFTEEASGVQSITFANAAHDYPQRISYAGEGDRLTARINLIDGSKPNEWIFTPCS